MHLFTIHLVLVSACILSCSQRDEYHVTQIHDIRFINEDVLLFKKIDFDFWEEYYPFGGGSGTKNDTSVLMTFSIPESKDSLIILNNFWDNKSPYRTIVKPPYLCFSLSTDEIAIFKQNNLDSLLYIIPYSYHKYSISNENKYLLQGNYVYEIATGNRISDKSLPADYEIIFYDEMSNVYFVSYEKYGQEGVGYFDSETNTFNKITSFSGSPWDYNYGDLGRVLILEEWKPKLHRNYYYITVQQLLNKSTSLIKIQNLPNRNKVSDIYLSKNMIIIHTDYEFDENVSNFKAVDFNGNTIFENN